MVLKGVNADIKRGEKIGIVGRTGAGKSSMTLALFRIIEPAEGAISIDNIDITHMGVGHLRSRFVISQKKYITVKIQIRISDRIRIRIGRNIFIILG